MIKVVAFLIAISFLLLIPSILQIPPKIDRRAPTLKLRRQRKRSVGGSRFRQTANTLTAKTRRKAVNPINPINPHR